MSWKVRHEGSPRSIDSLTLEQVVSGLEDGLWEPTDEVMGPEDTHWSPIESHPHLEEVAAELEPPPRKTHDDETRLDMTPLIDVTLVLLIFFILTTSYGAIQKMLEMGNLSKDAATGAIVVSPEQVKNLMIGVDIRKEQGKPVIRVEGKVVPSEDLVGVLSQYVRDTQKTALLVDYSNDVPFGEVIAVQDAAKGAGIQQVNYRAPQEEFSKRDKP